MNQAAVIKVESIHPNLYSESWIVTDDTEFILNSNSDIIFIDSVSGFWEEFQFKHYEDPDTSKVTYNYINAGNYNYKNSQELTDECCAFVKMPNYNVSIAFHVLKERVAKTTDLTVLAELAKKYGKITCEKYIPDIHSNKNVNNIGTKCYYLDDFIVDYHNTLIYAPGEKAKHLKKYNQSKKSKINSGKLSFHELILPLMLIVCKDAKRVMLEHYPKPFPFEIKLYTKSKNYNDCLGYIANSLKIIKSLTDERKYREDKEYNGNYLELLKTIKPESLDGKMVPTDFKEEILKELKECFNG